MVIFAQACAARSVAMRESDFIVEASFDDVICSRTSVGA